MTKYVDITLEPGEVLRYRTSLSRMIYRMPAVVSIIAAWVFFQMNAWDDQRVIGWAICAFLFCGYLFFVKWLRRLTTEIAVTNRRLIYKHGFIRRSTEELNLEAIGSVNLHQDILGRWFDCGFVIVRSFDGDWAGSQYLIDSPLALRATMTHSGGSFDGQAS